MMKKLKMLLSVLLCLSMVLSWVPMPALAAEDCTHHPQHTAECGYVEAVQGQECNHECSDACKEEKKACVHDCKTAGCTYVEPVEGVDCDHVCGDGTCAYRAAVPAVECSCTPEKVHAENCASRFPGACDCTPTVAHAEDCAALNEGECYCGAEPVHAENCASLRKGQCDCTPETVHAGDCQRKPAVKGVDCDHKHGDCAYVEAAEGYYDCDHECTVESGCIKLVCGHECPEDDCGYVAEVKGSECKFVCQECKKQEKPKVDEAVEAVKALIAALPTVDAVSAMTYDDKVALYNGAYMTAGNAYNVLTEEQKAEVDAAKLMALADFYADPSNLMTTDENIKMYEIWVADTQVTSANASDVLGDGTVSYDSAKNVLTLNNATICKSNGHAIKSDSSLTIDGTAASITGGIQAKGDLVIDAEITVMNNGNRMAMESTGGTTTIKGKVGDITVADTTFAIKGQKGVLISGSVGNIIDSKIGIHSAEGSVEITGMVGNINSEETGIYSGSGDITISGSVGDITSTKYSAIIAAGGTISIPASGSVGNLDTQENSIYAGRDVNIAGTVGTISSDRSGIASQNGDVVISGTVGTVTGKERDTIKAQNGSLTISKTTVTAISGTMNGFYASKGVSVTDGGNALAVGNGNVEVYGAYSMGNYAGEQSFAKLDVKKGATLTIPVGETVEVTISLTNNGEIVNHGMLILPVGFDIDELTSKNYSGNGIVKVGDQQYIMIGGKWHICADASTGIVITKNTKPTYYTAGDGVAIYDGEGNLTLHNASIDVTANNTAAIRTEVNLTVSGTGTNTIKAVSGSGIYANSGNVTINGTIGSIRGSTYGICAENGYVTVSGSVVSISGEKVGGVYAQNGLTISGTVSSIKGFAGITSANGVTIRGTVTEIEGTAGSGIYAKDGDVSIAGTGNAISIHGKTYGICAEKGKISIDGVAVTATGGSQNDVFAKNDTSITDSGTLKLSEKSSKGKISGGTLYIGEKGYVWNKTNQVYYCLDGEHSWNAAKPAVCSYCTKVRSAGSASVSIEDWEYGDKANAPVPSSETNSVENVTYFYKAKNAADDTYSENVPVAVGTYTVKAVFSANKNYEEAVATADFAITQRTLSIVAEAEGRVYAANDKTVKITTVSMENVVTGDDVAVTLPTGSKGVLSSDDAGEYDKITLPALTLKGKAASNYTLNTEDPVKLKSVVVITAKSLNSPDITVKLENDVLQYKKGETTKPVITVTDKDVDDKTVTLKEREDYVLIFYKDGKQVDNPSEVGKYTVKIMGYGEAAEDGANYNGWYGKTLTFLIEDAQSVIKLVDALPKPSAVEPDDEKTIKAYEEAKAAYDKLSEQGKELVDKETNYKLNRVFAALTDYRIIKGDKAKWTQGSGKRLSFTANGTYSKFEYIEIDGKKVSSKYYIAESGSTIITLRSSYLETLRTGRHKIQVFYTDGETNVATFRIVRNSGNPFTGDQIMIAVTVMALSAAALAAVFILKKKKK